MPEWIGAVLAVLTFWRSRKRRVEKGAPRDDIAAAPITFNYYHIVYVESASPQPRPEDGDEHGNSREESGGVYDQDRER